MPEEEEYQTLSEAFDPEYQKILGILKSFLDETGYCKGADIKIYLLGDEEEENDLLKETKLRMVPKKG